MIKSSINTIIVIALVFLATATEGAGLGRMRIHSAHKEPLNAEIDLTSTPPDELPNIKVRVASDEAFRRARIEKLAFFKHLNFSVDPNNGVNPKIRITSSEPCLDFFMDILLELNWSSGRIIREYTILLDPRSKPNTTIKTHVPSTTKIKPFSTTPSQNTTKLQKTRSTEPQPRSPRTLAQWREWKKLQTKNIASPPLVR